MAHELGISKKTLVGIEKGRSSLGWTGSAALCLLFGDSATLRRELKEDPRGAAVGLRSAAGLRARESTVPHCDVSEISEAADAREASSPLWRHVSDEGIYRIEQNVISEHYRLVDERGRRIFAAFDLNEVKRAASARENSSGGGEGGDPR